MQSGTSRHQRGPSSAAKPLVCQQLARCTVTGYQPLLQREGERERERKERERKERERERQVCPGMKADMQRERDVQHCSIKICIGHGVCPVLATSSFFVTHTHTQSTGRSRSSLVAMTAGGVGSIPTS